MVSSCWLVLRASLSQADQTAYAYVNMPQHLTALSDKPELQYYAETVAP